MHASAMAIQLPPPLLLRFMLTDLVGREKKGVNTQTVVTRWKPLRCLDGTLWLIFAQIYEIMESAVYA
jgi:hypothetical protein